MEKLDQCRLMHNYLIRKLKDKDFRRVGEVLDLEIDSEPHILKTILIATKAFKENEWIRGPRQRIVDKLQPKA